MKSGIILSAGRLPKSMTAEIGMVPPIFLPLGGKCLLNEQVKYLDVDQITVTLPNDFSLSENQENCLSELKVKVIATSPDISVLEAFQTALGSRKLGTDHELHILMGDTLFSGLKNRLPDNFFTVDNKLNDYEFTSLGKNEQVFTGYIKLSGKRSNEEIIKTVDQILNGYHDKKISTICPDNWFNLGHFNDFFQSKIKFVKSRYFNNLDIDNYTTTKKSKKKDKIKSEIEWYKNLPTKMRKYASHLYTFDLSSEVGEYTINTNHGHQLSDLHVFYDVSDFNWKLIYSEIECYLSDVNGLKIFDTFENQKIFDDFFVNKTNLRILEYSKECSVDPQNPLRINSKIFPSIYSMLESVEHKRRILSQNAFNCTKYIHGDLCFSNAFFDFRSKKITFIDPRGFDPNLQSAAGPFLYELSKLAHSALFNYDNVINECYELSENGLNNFDFKVFSTSRIVHHYEIKRLLNLFLIKEIDLLYGVFHLFISMVPLHSEDKRRQKVLIGIACEIYEKIEACKFD